MFSRDVEIYTNKKNILEGSALSCSQWFSVRREQKIKCDNQKKMLRVMEDQLQGKCWTQIPSACRKAGCGGMSLQLWCCVEAETGGFP